MRGVGVVVGVWVRLEVGVGFILVRVRKPFSRKNL